MNRQNKYAACMAAFGLVFGGTGFALAAADTPPVAESTPSEIKDRKPLAQQIDEYNANAKKSSSRRDKSTRDPAVDPKANQIAEEVNAYNARSQPDDSAAAVDERRPRQIDRQRSNAEREATDRLSQEVRDYNRSGGASAGRPKDRE